MKTWVRSRTWQVAHLLHNDRTEDFLGVIYKTSLCGKRVRADRVEVNQRPGMVLDPCAKCAAVGTPA